jgi:hypothetical protein
MIRGLGIAKIRRGLESYARGECISLRNLLIPLSPGLWGASSFQTYHETFLRFPVYARDADSLSFEACLD